MRFSRKLVERLHHFDVEKKISTRNNKTSNSAVPSRKREFEFSDGESTKYRTHPQLYSVRSTIKNGGRSQYMKVERSFYKAEHKPTKQHRARWWEHGTRGYIPELQSHDLRFSETDDAFLERLAQSLPQTEVIPVPEIVYGPPDTYIAPRPDERLEKYPFERSENYLCFDNASGSNWRLWPLNDLLETAAPEGYFSITYPGSTYPEENSYRNFRLHELQYSNNRERLRQIQARQDQFDDTLLRYSRKEREDFTAHLIDDMIEWKYSKPRFTFRIFPPHWTKEPSKWD